MWLLYPVFFYHANEVQENRKKEDVCRCGDARPFLLPLGLRKPLVLPGVNKKALANIFGDTRAKIRRKGDLSLKGTRSFLHKVSGLQK